MIPVITGPNERVAKDAKDVKVVKAVKAVNVNVNHVKSHVVVTENAANEVLPVTIDTVKMQRAIHGHATSHQHRPNPIQIVAMRIVIVPLIGNVIVSGSGVRSIDHVTKAPTWKSIHLRTATSCVDVQL